MLNDEDYYEEYKNTLFSERLRDYGFNENQIKIIWYVYSITCRYCFDADDGCQCWNDE